MLHAAQFRAKRAGAERRILSAARRGGLGCDAIDPNCSGSIGEAYFQICDWCVEGIVIEKRDMGESW